MHNINRKSKIIETYCLELIDLVGIILSYGIALLLRFESADEISFLKVHYSMGIYILLFSLLYNIFSDWNRGFFERDKLTELVAIIKFNAILSLAIGCLVFFDEAGATVFQTGFWLFYRL